MERRRPATSIKDGDDPVKSVPGALVLGPEDRPVLLLHADIIRSSH